MLSMHVELKSYTDLAWAIVWRSWNPVLHALLPNFIILGSNTQGTTIPFIMSPIRWFAIPLLLTNSFFYYFFLLFFLQTSTPYIADKLRLLYCFHISQSHCLQVHRLFGNPITIFGQLCFLYVGTLVAELLWTPVLHFNLHDTLGISLTFRILFIFSCRFSGQPEFFDPQ